MHPFSSLLSSISPFTAKAPHDAAGAKTGDDGRFSGVLSALTPPAASPESKGSDDLAGPVAIDPASITVIMASLPEAAGGSGLPIAETGGKFLPGALPGGLNPALPGKPTVLAGNLPAAMTLRLDDAPEAAKGAGEMAPLLAVRKSGDIATGAATASAATTPADGASAPASTPAATASDAAMARQGQAAIKIVAGGEMLETPAQRLITPDSETGQRLRAAAAPAAAPTAAAAEDRTVPGPAAIQVAASTKIMAESKTAASGNHRVEAGAKKVAIAIDGEKLVETADMDTSQPAPHRPVSPATRLEATAMPGKASDAVQQLRAAGVDQMGEQAPRGAALVQDGNGQSQLTSIAPNATQGSDVAAAMRHPAAPAQNFQDLAQIVDRLAAAREAVTATSASLAIDHAEFGELSLRFDQRQTGQLTVELAAKDADVQRAVAAALGGERSASTGQDQSGTNSQQHSQNRMASSDRESGGSAAHDPRQDQTKQRASAARGEQRNKTDEQPRDGIFA